MNIRFYSDPETGLPHIYSHGVTEDEVEEVLLSPGEDWLGRRTKITRKQSKGLRTLPFRC